MTTRLCRTPVLKLFPVLLLLFAQVFFTAVPAYSASFSSISIVPFGRIPYVSMVELAETFRLRIDYDPFTCSMTITRGTNSLKLSNRSRIVRCNGSMENLMAPARLFHGTLYAPAATCMPLFSELIPGKLVWDEKEWAVTSTGAVGSIDSISFEERTQGTLIRISLAESLKCSDVLREVNDQRWLHIRLENGVYNPEPLLVNPPTGMVQTVRTFPGYGETFVSFLVSNEMESYDINRNSGQKELFISLRTKRSAPVASSKETVPGKTPAAISIEPYTNGKLWVIDTIVIDPGHGGRDSGATGPKGTKEKDVVLAIGREFKKYADKRGEIKTVLTRNRDEFISLRKRAKIARDVHGKLFISIHANSSRSKYVRGMEVFFLSEAKTESAKRVAERENASIEFEENPEYYATLFNNDDMSRELREIQGDMAYNVFLKESQDMCAILLDTSLSATRQRNRGVKQAGFYVMLGTQYTMPSVLFEIGFISNSGEEKLLRRASYQKKVAQAIYDSVIKFKRRVERDLITMSGSQ